MEDSYVRIMKCKFCGKETNAIALHKRLKPIKEDVFDEEPCDSCKKLFTNHKFFIGNCGHFGFIKTEALKRILRAESFKALNNYKMIRMEECFACMQGKDVSQYPQLNSHLN